MKNIYVNTRILYRCKHYTQFCPLLSPAICILNMTLMSPGNVSEFMALNNDRRLIFNRASYKDYMYLAWRV